MMPNGVSMARPPALMTPFALVWQTTQSPRAASCRPRSTVAAENTDASGRAIGAIDRHGSVAEAMPMPAATTAAMVANAPRRSTNGFRHLSAEAGGWDGVAGNTPWAEG